VGARGRPLWTVSWRYVGLEDPHEIVPGCLKVRDDELDRPYGIPGDKRVDEFTVNPVVFLGNGVVAWSGRQLRMDVIVAMMPLPVQKVLALAAELTFIVVAVAIVVFAWPVIRDLWLFDQRSQSAELPMVIPQVMIPIGLSIMAFLVVVRLLTGGDRVPSDPSGH